MACNHEIFCIYSTGISADSILHQIIVKAAKQIGISFGD